MTTLPSNSTTKQAGGRRAGAGRPKLHATAKDRKAAWRRRQGKPERKIVQDALNKTCSLTVVISWAVGDRGCPMCGCPTTWYRCWLCQNWSAL